MGTLASDVVSINMQTDPADSCYDIFLSDNTSYRYDPRVRLDSTERMPLVISDAVNTVATDEVARAIRDLTARISKEQEEESLRKKVPTLAEAWKQYQDILKLVQS